jgi:competence protein ComEC
MIDPTSLARDGAHAVWLEPGGIRLLSVHAGQGDRPWTPASEEASPDTDQ